MSIARIVARYTENTQDTITLLCGIDGDNQIRQGEWFGVVKNDDGQGDESNYPFTLHIDYQKKAFYLDYGFDEADTRQLQEIDIQQQPLAENGVFTIVDVEEGEEYSYKISSIHLYD
ncbi:hypothetical protein ACQKDS_11390 [Serratia sp. NPDC078593]|uniref:hypothetical protein n=1 Tax=unclassified Serratia (in: enterobacteria) TaxID=2647522 RepID=UPI0037D68258